MEADILPRFANPGKRLVARMIDGLIVALGAIIVIIPLGIALVSDDPPETAIVVFIISIFVIVYGGSLFYEALQLAKCGQTVGKRVMKIRVVPAGAPGAPLSRRKAFGRAACYPTGFSLIGSIIPVISMLDVLWLLWDRPLRQCLHDKMADTIVIDVS